MREEPLILLVEDREDDILVLRKAFERAAAQTALQVARDGEEAIWYLSGTGKYSNRAEYPLPSLVLLDLRMPRVDGFEVLRWIRNQSGLAALIVIVLSSSEQTKDINHAYKLGANSYMVKSLEFKDATASAAMIKNYWLQCNSLPIVFRHSGPKAGGENN
jgi:CheY-like chemotaxis protein